MLARAEVKKLKLNSSIQFLRGDVLRLPFSDHSFDAVTFAFGIRNVSSVETAFSEICRVLKPGGRLGILEFGRPQRQSLLTRSFAFYQSHLLPLVGGLLTGDSQAYRYLDASSKTFPSGEEFLSKMKTAGFEETRSIDLSMAYIYLGNSPDGP
jgi:demethylmenaquinone methyltransferase/2-methoxy-6-polyprenyl-1,4-benzoquinol methylase